MLHRLTLKKITLFYAQTSGRINVLDFRPNSGWEDGSDLGKFLGVDPILDEDSRSLSVTILPQNWTTYPEGLDVLLFYCGAQSKPKGRLTILRSAREQMLWMKTQWHDISETVGETYSSIVAPFTSGMNSDKAINSETPEAYMGFVRQDGPNQIEAIFPYNNESFYMGKAFFLITFLRQMG